MSEKLASLITKNMATWRFVIAFLTLSSAWMWANVDGIVKADPFPFILLNLMMSTLASIQAPIIMIDSRRNDARNEAQLQKILELEQHILEMKDSTNVQDSL